MGDRYFGSQIDRIKKPFLGIAAIGAAVAVACGGSGENRQVGVDATKTPETIRTVLPIPTKVDAPTVEPGDNGKFLEKADELIGLIDQNTTLTDEQVDALRQGFAKDWQKAAGDEYLKYGAFYDIRNGLAARNKTVPEAAVVVEMKRVQDFMATTAEWETFYKASLEDGAFGQ